MRRGVRRVVCEIAEVLEPLVGVAVSVGVERAVVCAGRGARDLAVVGIRVEIEDAEAVFEQVDGGDEGVALDAVEVERIGVAIGGGDENDSVGHEGL